MNMNNFRTPILLAGLLLISTALASAAQLASAKVVRVEGTVTVYPQEGAERQLQKGDIITQGDEISATALSSADLVFSNGSLMTIQENTSVSFRVMEQSSFGGGKTYEELEADPSKSQNLLELNYGTLSGKVKKLRNDSAFNIETALGTAAIRGTPWSVSLRYNAERREFILFVSNRGGLVDIISRYLGEFEYGKGNIGDKNFDSGITDAVREPVPPGHTAIIRLRADDPLFESLIDFAKNFPPYVEGDDYPFGDDDDDDDDDDDFGIIVISPEVPDDDDDDDDDIFRN